MPGGGSQPAGNTTTTNLPPQYMYPYIGTAMGQANDILQNGGANYYPGDTVAGFNDPQQRAMTGIYNVGINGSGALKAANRFDKTLLNGGGSNPYEDAMFQHAMQMSQPMLQSEFAGAGADLAGAMPQRAQEYSDAMNSFYGNQYQQNMDRALQAGNQAQDLYRTRLSGLGAAEGVGQQVQDQAQKLINADKAKYDFYQNKPAQNLQDYLREIWSGTPGSSTNSPYFNNPTANAAGMASIAAALYSMFGSSGAAAAAA